MYNARSIGVPQACRDRLDWLASSAGLFVSRGMHQGRPSRARLLQEIGARSVRLVKTDTDRIPVSLDAWSVPFSLNLPDEDWAALEAVASLHHVDSWRSLVRLIGDGAFDLVLPDGRIVNALDMPPQTAAEARDVTPDLRAASYA